MGKAASRFTQAIGLGRNNPNTTLNGNDDIFAPKPPQWDTSIDQLFGDAPPDDTVIDPATILDPPIRPRRRRPPPPPPRPNRGGRRRPLPSSPGARRRHNRGGVQPMRTPIVPDMPRRIPKGGVHAINAPFGVNRRPMVLPAPISEREKPARIAFRNSFKRRPSIHRGRTTSQRTQRLQELLQCPVCLTPYTEPRLLPCGHTYCDECLNRLIENDNDIVQCPECRKQHVVPEDGVFPPNFVVRNLLEEHGISTGSRAIPSGNLSLNGTATAKCTTCETFAPLRLCRHCNFMVCDRCLKAHRHGDQDGFHKKSKIYSGKLIQFYIAVRKITRSNSQVKRLTIEMPIGNYLQDTCETLIRRIADREQLHTSAKQLVLEFGDKRLRHQRTLASYGVQNGDLLFLFNPEQRLNFLAYEDEENLPESSSLTSNRQPTRFRSDSYNSSASDIRTTTSNDLSYNRTQHPLSPISDHNNDIESLYSDN
ncbi:unnamed protein product [Adineta steineri]|uniref:Uncharacterized protein n=1 Tax=Adineta steineri TaxID=433720 RepID=A0A814J4Z2_9BILA|nr:unnamed protein product [Adineta steineri]